MMAGENSSSDVSAELAALKYEMKNQKMKSLPPNTMVKRRPLHHPPVASPHAGAHVQKVVYVSNHTPIMSAVKRVKKLLSNAEKRAVQATDTRGHSSAKSFAGSADLSDRAIQVREEVLVKASGRAMQQALRIGEWFRAKEKEMICNVEVRTSSVQAIDDIVETEEGQESDENAANEGVKNDDGAQKDETVPEGGSTTMELLGDAVKPADGSSAMKALDSMEVVSNTPDLGKTEPSKKRKRTRRKRVAYDSDNVPEARIRWVKTVEIAISLKA